MFLILVLKLSIVKKTEKENCLMFFSKQSVCFKQFFVQICLCKELFEKKSLITTTREIDCDVVNFNRFIEFVKIVI